MKYPIYQVDAFTTSVFAGNPAAVIPLRAWLTDELMQAVAMENQLSETAFCVEDESGWLLRWFTPTDEVDLCGHATLATAHTLWNECGVTQEVLRFQTRSGELQVVREGSEMRLDLPAQAPRRIDATDLEAQSARVAPLLAGLGSSPSEIWSSEDWVAVFESEEQIRQLRPDYAELASLGLRGVLATAPGEKHDFVSRCFFPSLGVDEDPVTGSAHAQLAPFWAQRLRREELLAAQLSARGGVMRCAVSGERVHLFGEARTYLRGEIELPER